MGYKLLYIIRISQFMNDFIIQIIDSQLSVVTSNILKVV